MNDSNIGKILINLMCHLKISELESLDLSLLRKLENQAEKELEAASEMLDWVEAIRSGRLQPDDDSGQMERKVDKAVVDASKRLQWISSIIDMKLGVRPDNGNDD